MYPHHAQSIQNLKEYFMSMQGMIAIVLDGSIVKGNERPDSDIDALIVVTEETYGSLAAQNRLAEVITGHCTYEGGSPLIRNTNWKRKSSVLMPIYSSTEGIFCTVCRKVTRICALISHRRSYTAYIGSFSPKTGCCSPAIAGWKKPF